VSNFVPSSIQEKHGQTGVSAMESHQDGSAGAHEVKEET